MENLRVGIAPHRKHDDTVKSLCLDVLIALTPALVWGVYVFGPRAFVLTLLSVFSCCLFSFLTALFTGGKRNKGDLTSLITGLILALLLPVSTPHYVVPLGAGFATVIVKGLFGGTGKNFLNPALAAKAFLVLSFPRFAHRFTRPFAHLPVFGLKYEELEGFLSDSSLSLAADESVTLSQLFTGSHPSCIGEGSALLLLAGLAYLLVKKTVTWHVPASYLAAAAGTTLLLSGNAMFTLRSLLSGSVLLVCFFCATDPVTSPVTRWGKLCYGVIAGIFTSVLIHFSNPDGAVFATLVASLSVTLLDRLFIPRPYGKRLFEKKGGKA